MLFGLRSPVGVLLGSLHVHHGFSVPANAAFKVTYYFAAVPRTSACRCQTMQRLGAEVTWLAMMFRLASSVAAHSDDGSRRRLGVTSEPRLWWQLTLEGVPQP